jgi:hypothetical protein
MKLDEGQVVNDGGLFRVTVALPFMVFTQLDAL